MRHNLASIIATLLVLTSLAEAATTTTTTTTTTSATTTAGSATDGSDPVQKDDCDQCGPTRLIGCRSGRCYYKCIRRCLGKDNKFYYEALKFNFAGQRKRRSADYNHWPPAPVSVSKHHLASNTRAG